MLEIEAQLTHEAGGARATLATGGRAHALPLVQRPDGRGLATNGGELLCLALAACFTNDLHREAAPRGIRVERVDVTVRSVFGAAGEPARSLAYRVRVAAAAPADDIRALIAHTDRVAEVHGTLRRGMPVTLESVEVETVPDPAAGDGPPAAVPHA